MWRDIKKGNQLQNLTSLRAFHSLYHHHSLTAASKALGLSKSTLSRRLQMLEEEIGQSLVIRSGNGLVMTKAGELFFEYCDKILSLADEGMSAIESLNTEVSGEINIVANGNLIRGWLSPLIDEFLESNPKLSIRLISQCKPYVESVEPDVIFWVGELNDLNWRKEVLGKWCCKLFASPDYLKNAPALNHPRDLVNHTQIDYLDVYGKKVILQHSTFPDFVLENSHSRLKSDSAILQLESVIRGRGVGLLPMGLYKKFNQAHPEKLEMCLPEWSAEPKHIYCYVPMGRLPLRVIKFLDQVRCRFPAPITE